MLTRHQQRRRWLTFLLVPLIIVVWGRVAMMVLQPDGAEDAADSWTLDLNTEVGAPADAEAPALYAYDPSFRDPFMPPSLFWTPTAAADTTAMSVTPSTDDPPAFVPPWQLRGIVGQVSMVVNARQQLVLARAGDYIDSARVEQVLPTAVTLSYHGEYYTLSLAP